MLFFSFNKHKNIYFSFLAAGFCPKNNGFARVWAQQPPSPSGSYAYEHNVISFKLWTWNVVCRITKLNNGIISAFTKHSLLLCVDLETSNYWSASIGVGNYSYDKIDSSHWTTNLSYVCQYHSKSFLCLCRCLKIAYSSHPSLIRRPRFLSSLWNFAVKLSVRKLESWGYSVVKIAWS